MDMHGRPVDSNPALQQMLGYTADEVKRRNIDTLSHPDEVTVEKEMFQSLAQGQREFYTLRKRYPHKDGTYIFTHLIVSLIRNAMGQPRYAIGQVLRISSDGCLIT